MRGIKCRRLNWTGLARMAEGRSSFIILTDKPIRKRSLGRPRHRWEDNIRMFLKKWDDSVQDRDHFCNFSVIFSRFTSFLSDFFKFY